MRKLVFSKKQPTLCNSTRSAASFSSLRNPQGYVEPANGRIVPFRCRLSKPADIPAGIDKSLYLVSRVWSQSNKTMAFLNAVDIIHRTSNSSSAKASGTQAAILISFQCGGSGSGSCRPADYCYSVFVGYCYFRYGTVQFCRS